MSRSAKRTLAFALVVAPVSGHLLLERHRQSVPHCGIPSGAGLICESSVRRCSSKWSTTIAFRHPITCRIHPPAFRLREVALHAGP